MISGCAIILDSLRILHSDFNHNESNPERRRSCGVTIAAFAMMAITRAVRRIQARCLWQWSTGNTVIAMAVEAKFTVVVSMNCPTLLMRWGGKRAVSPVRNPKKEARECGANGTWFARWRLWRESFSLLGSRGRLSIGFTRTVAWTTRVGKA